MDICYIKETPYNENKAEGYYLRVFASEYSYVRYFLSKSQAGLLRIQNNKIINALWQVNLPSQLRIVP